MSNFKLYRKRLIPNEMILLHDDLILEHTDEFIITKWKVLHPKAEFHHGVSCYCLNKGIKVSKFYREDNSLFQWYIDIVDYQWSDDKSELVVLDLLADVTIDTDGNMKVLDLDEIAMALDKEVLSIELLKKCMNRLHHLLHSIYDGSFKKIQNHLEETEQKNEEACIP